MEDLHKIWGHRWLTPKAKPSKSEMNGIGIIAKEPISNGELVYVVGGIVVPKIDIKKFRKLMGHNHVGLRVDADFFFCPSLMKEFNETGALNHSCEPNVGFANAVKMIAIKDIHPEEELTFEYAFSEDAFEPFTCNCGSANCRKVIRPDDWKNPELQKKYGEWFSPYLKAKFQK